MSATVEIKPQGKDKAIRSYVIRGGRITDGQRKAFAAHWPYYGLSLFDGPLDYKHIFGRQAPVVVEIGFGMGDSLLRMVAAEPDKDFIGVEVHPPGVGRLINNAAKAKCKNLRVYMADATDVLQDCIADSSIDRFQVYFPDPWPKKKHHKRRLVQPELIQCIRRKLNVGGRLHFATDWEGYAEHMMAVMTAAEGFTNLAGLRHYSPRPDYRPITKFEKRGKGLGHGVWDLLFERAC